MFLLAIAMALLSATIAEPSLWQIAPACVLRAVRPRFSGLLE